MYAYTCMYVMSFKLSLLGQPALRQAPHFTALKLGLALGTQRSKRTLPCSEHIAARCIGTVVIGKLLQPTVKGSALHEHGAPSPPCALQ